MNGSDGADSVAMAVDVDATVEAVDSVTIIAETENIEATIIAEITTDITEIEEAIIVEIIGAITQEPNETYGTRKTRMPPR